MKSRAAGPVRRQRGEEVPDGIPEPQPNAARGAVPRRPSKKTTAASGGPSAGDQPSGRGPRGNGEAKVPAEAPVADKRPGTGPTAKPVFKSGVPEEEQFPMPELQDNRDVKDLGTVKQPSARRSRRGIRLKNGVRL